MKQKQYYKNLLQEIIVSRQVNILLFIFYNRLPHWRNSCLLIDVIEVLVNAMHSGRIRVLFFKIHSNPKVGLSITSFVSLLVVVFCFKTDLFQKENNADELSAMWSDFYMDVY